MSGRELPPPPLPGAQDRWALFVDVDGTLLPFADRPEDVAPSPEVAATLKDLAAALEGALVVLSGRPLADLRRLLPGLPDTHLLGCHGLEEAGATPVARPVLEKARAGLEASLASLDGVWIEAKPHAFAIHYRANPAAGYLVRRKVSEHLTRFETLRAIAGNNVVEVLPVDGSKGGALARVWARLDRRCPVAVGDDVTDEEAFAAAQRRSGFGVLVGVRRPTLASYSLPCVRTTHIWLTRVADALKATA